MEMEGNASGDTPKESDTPVLVDAVDEEQNVAVDEEPSSETAVQDSGTGEVDNDGDDNLDVISQEDSRTQAPDQTDDLKTNVENTESDHVESDLTDAASPQPAYQSAAVPATPDSSDGNKTKGEQLASATFESSDDSEASTDGHTSVQNENVPDSENALELEAAPACPYSIGSGSSLETQISAEGDDGDTSPLEDEVADVHGVSNLNVVDSDDHSNPSSGADDDDITSRAAIALAAVAVAANAKHSSPSAAAQAARALAPGIMPGAGMSPRRNEDMKVVSLKAVKHFMKMKPPNSMLLQKLADGENDAFLQYLLLLEFFRVDKDPEPDVPRSPSAMVEDDSKNGKDDGQKLKEDRGVFDEELAALAAERVRCMLGVIGGAYDSMVGLLPAVPQPQMQNNDDVDCDFDGIESPPVIPDLLPPCASTSSDATAEFFRECAGPCESEDKIAKGEEDTDPEKAGELHSTNTSGASEAGHSTASSVLSSMFTSVKRSSISSPRASLTGVFRKRNRRHVAVDKKGRDSLTKNDSQDDDLADGEYSVLIEREMLGLTVENVLERTVVRTVLPGGAAKSAGARVGSLIVKVGNVPTKNLTHFETIDELRQSQRPLRLVMRQISPEALCLAREEMGRLIRGAGFGMITGDTQRADKIIQHSQDAAVNDKRMKSRRPQIESYSRVLHERWNCDDLANQNANVLPVDRAAEKLVWILTLLIYGLEIEAGRKPSPAETRTEIESPQEKQRHQHHDAKDYSDASKSISRVLLDFVKKNVEICDKSREKGTTSTPIPMNLSMHRRGRRLPPPPLPPSPGTRNFGSSSTIDPNNPLIQIGDVLHRTYTFLADPTSPPAALLRGEVIAFLCDVLDIDTQMELSEEENASSTAGKKAGPISDLGSAGSLLKLIVLNCSMMRSPDCGIHDGDQSDYLLNEQKRRFGYRRQFSSVDAHRLHAGNRFLAVVHRLAASRSLSARVTACSLGPVLWGHLDFPHQLQVRADVVYASMLQIRLLTSRRYSFLT